MERPGRPAAVVFDLDGTLVDTVPARIRAWREVLGTEGMAVDDATLAPLIGMDGRALARDVGRRFDRHLDDDDAERIDRDAGARFDEINRDPVPLPGARKALAALDAAGTTWAIATSSRAEQVAASVRALALPAPPRIVDGSRVAHAKPAPDLLLLAAEELEVEPRSAWYVGDSTWDMRAAVAAGMRAIAVLQGAAVGRAALRAAGASIVLADLSRLHVRP